MHCISLDNWKKQLKHHTMLGTGDIIYVFSTLDVPHSPTCTVFKVDTKIEARMRSSS